MISAVDNNIIWGMSGTTSGAYCQQWTTIRGATCICDAGFSTAHVLLEQGLPETPFHTGHVWGMSGTTSGAYCQQWTAICGATCICDAVFANMKGHALGIGLAGLDDGRSFLTMRIGNPAEALDPSSCTF